MVVGVYMVVGGRGLSRSRLMNRVRDTVAAGVSMSGNVVVANNVLLSMSLSVNMLLDILVRLGRRVSNRSIGVCVGIVRSNSTTCATCATCATRPLRARCALRSAYTTCSS